MPALASILAWVLTNPQIIAAGEAALQDVINFVTGASALHKQGVLSDAQLAQVWAAMGVNIQTADDAWDAALAAHVAKKGAA